MPDNDATVDPEWLKKLEACALETGADFVEPLYLIGSPERRRVHTAGGLNRILDIDGRRYHLEPENLADRHCEERKDELVVVRKQS